MESTKFLRAFTDKLQNSLIYLLISILVVLSLSNLCMVIIFEENNVEKRYKAMYFCTTITCMCTCMMDRRSRPENVSKLTDLIEGEFIENFYKLGNGNTKWERIHKNYSKRREYMEVLYGKMYIITMGVYLSQLGRHLMNELLLGNKSKDVFKDWPTPFPYWCPPGYDNVIFFLIVETMQSVLVYFMLLEGFCHILTTCLATERVLTDFATIYMLIDSLTEDFPDSRHEDYLKKTQTIGDGSQQIVEKLRRDVAVLVKCHQNLYSNFKTCADYSAYGTVVLTFIIYSDTVISIYTMLKANNVKIMINFAVACIFVNLIILFCYHNGQKILNQNNNLRQYLTEVPWIDKPTWFKSSLCIMMRRANLDTELKPYSVYVLNHESFKNILKAAFSFGNIIYSVKSNT